MLQGGTDWTGHCGRACKRPNAMLTLPPVLRRRQGGTLAHCCRTITLFLPIPSVTSTSPARWQHWQAHWLLCRCEPAEGSYHSLHRF